jgi:hypothetical protein
MGKARAIVLKTRTFTKHGDARDFFSAMLKRYSLGERVSDADAIELTALMARHDEEAEKVGIGIDYFSVNPAPEYPDQRCFWITRTDGSRIDVSYQHCLEKKAYD